MKIVLNKCYGGFGLSDRALDMYWTRKDIKFHVWDEGSFTTYTTIPRETYLELKEQHSQAETWEDKKPIARQLNEAFLSEYDIDRTDPDLVHVVETLGEEANGRFSDLKVVEIPDDIEWYIDEYDGVETVREQHRSW